MDFRKINEELKTVLEEFEPHYTIVGQPGRYTYNYTVSDAVGGTWFGDERSPGYFETKEDAINAIRKNKPDAKILDANDLKKEKYQAQQEIILSELIENGVDAVPGFSADEVVIGDNLYQFWRTMNGGYGFCIWNKDKTKCVQSSPEFAKDEVDLAAKILKESQKFSN